MKMHMPHGPTGENIKLWTLWLFAAPNLALAIMHVPVNMVLPAFYAKHTQISLAAIGTVLLLGRLFDAVTDPLVGFLSDRSRTTFGRRKPWIVAGLPLACVAVVFLFTPPADADAAYFLLWSVLLFAGWTLIEIPYAAWATELSRGYQERSRIVTIRSTFGFVGGLLFMASPLLLSPWIGTTEIGAEALAIAGWVVAISLPLLMVVTVIKVPTGPQVSVSSTSARSLLKAMLINKPLRFYAAVSVANGIATGAWGASVLLFADSFGLGGEFPLILMTAWGTVVCVAPLWLKLSYRIGKQRIWALSLLLSGLVTPLAFFVSPGPTALPLFLVYVFVLGAIEAAWLVAPLAVYGDVIDYDTLKTGADQAGSYFAIYGLLLKAALALGGGIAFWILSLVDYNVKGGNTDSQMLGLYLSFCILPSLIRIAMSLAVLKFPIDARRHGIILRRIESRAARAAGLGS